MTDNFPAPKTRFKGVELLRLGKWRGALGEVEILPEHLASIVASSADPEVDTAALKIGHFDKRFDGEPALGYVENPRLSADGTRLVGDLADIPTKLAGVIRDAYRRRSAELRRAVTTPSGKTYPMTLTGLAFLGVEAPAVKGLADLEDLYASEELGTGADEFITLAESDTDAVPPATGGDGQPSKQEGNPTGGPDESNPKGVPTVALNDILKAKLGLPATATDAEIEAALEAAELAAPKADADQDADKGDQGDKSTSGEGDKDGAPAAPAAPEGDKLSQGPATVTVSKVQWDEMNETLKGLVAKDQAATRKATIEEALSAGKISPAEVGHYEALLSAAPEQGRVLLSSLAPRYSTSPIGDSVVLSADNEAAAHAEADRLGL
jgi:hypothetical protein